MMVIQKKQVETQPGIKLVALEDGSEIGRAYVYVLCNDLHEEPFALIEDVFVLPEFRGRQIGTQLMNECIAVAKEKKCYKIILQSRHENTRVHTWYETLGFSDHGLNFRMNLV